jgi:sodium-dependent phosphate cotransporter
MTNQSMLDCDDSDGQDTNNFNIVEEDAGSLVQIPLNDENEGSAETAITKLAATRMVDDAKSKEQRPSSSNSVTYVLPTNNAPGHHRHSSRIGNIYRTTKEKGIHLIGPSAHDTGAPSVVVNDLHDLQEEDATWNEVFTACCCHSLSGWAYILGVVAIILLLLYFFMVGLDMLSASFQVVSGCTAGSLLGSDTNPLASFLIGIVATALLQSSSTTTSIVVSMCGAGLDVQAGIYIVMGANVGTSVTSIIVSLTHMGDSKEIEAAFAGSSLYYLFNILTAIILLPLEIGTQYLYRLTKAMLPSSVGEGDSWNSPIKAIVSPLTKTIIIANKQVVTDISTGAVNGCEVYYPVECDNGNESFLACKAGLIGCNEDNNQCPAFFQNGATKSDDMVSGYVCLVLAIVILCMCLVALVALLRMVLLGASRRIIYKATKMNGILAILIGIGVTILVQSSSATSSALVPLAGVGVLKLENMYPLLIGADIGTTFTALMAALVSSELESLQIALAHVFFNVTGAFLWYPLPFMRRFVFSLARRLGIITRHWQGFPVFFILVVFFVVPLLLLGISTCFEKKTAGFTALGIFVVILLLVGIIWFWVWWRFKSGKDKFLTYLSNRRRRTAAINTLADDMDFMRVDIEYCKKEIAHIKDFASIPYTSRMEEGLPQHVGETKPAAASEIDDAVSLYQSCVSAPWTQVLVGAANSIQDEIPSRSFPPSVYSRHSQLASAMSASGRSARHRTYSPPPRVHEEEHEYE